MLRKLQIKIVFYAFISLIAFHESSIGQTVYKGSWRIGETGNVTSGIGLSCTKPQIVVEEDFTDSAFDGHNSGVNGQNWEFFGRSIEFRKPNNRTTFPMAVSRNPFVSAGGWQGVKWGNKINPALGHIDQNLKEYKIDKKDDVFITKFKGFSDFANKNERAGIEVANMEWRTVLCPHPDYCHDLSFEAKQNFYSRPQDDLQLETNVENTTDRGPFGARRAHYNNLTTKADLNKEYDNLVVWRNDMFKRKSNIEQWGALNYGDFWLDTHMVSKLDPSNRYAIISEVQVSLFAGDTNFTLYRDGIDKHKAQIGILNVHSGITKRSDFTLDYRIDDNDVAVLKRYLGRTDSATIRRGDANNDTKITAEDCNAVSAFWSDSTMYPDSASARAIYSPIPNPGTEFGTFTLKLKSINYLSFKLPAGSNLSNFPLALSQTADVFNLNGANGEITLFWKDGFSGSTPPLSFSGASGSNLPQNVEFTVNYMGSCNSDGFSFNLDSIFVATEVGQQLEPLVAFKWNNLGFKLPASVQNLEISIHDLVGRKFATFRNSKETLNGGTAQIPSGVWFFSIRNAESGKVLERRKAFIQ